MKKSYLYFAKTGGYIFITFSGNFLNYPKATNEKNKKDQSYWAHLPYHMDIYSFRPFSLIQ
jgi:hypothetical protein